MSGNYPKYLPAPHRKFLDNCERMLQSDNRIVGLAVGGSFLDGTMDEFSDLDLVIGVEPQSYAAVLDDRQRVAAALGPLLSAFTGEHVGEPRLLICLYDRPLLHVDLKFVDLADCADRVEDPHILWDRDGRLEIAISKGEPHYPQPDPEWIEERFWTWVHYGLVRIERGELFEAIGFLAFLRERVLTPLEVVRMGQRPAGVRKVESVAPEFAERLKSTVATHDPASCLQALRACVELYQELRRDAFNDSVANRAEEAVLLYLKEVEARYSGMDDGE